MNNSMDYVYIDTRPKWMLQEDEKAPCFLQCGLFTKCSSKFGLSCNRLGGHKIPKIHGTRKRK